MLTHRTNILLSKEENELLEQLSREKKQTKGELIRHALQKTYLKSSSSLTARQKAFRRIANLRKKMNTEGISYKELIDYGRRP